MKISVIIPARNEQVRVCEVVRAAVAAKLVSDVVVVDNCSTDETALEACKCGALVLSCPIGGKGEAVAFALKQIEPDIAIICDADVRGINPEHFDRLVQPVISGIAIQTCGLFGMSRTKRWFGQFHAGLTGFRAFRPEILWEIYPLDYSGWALETALNSICRWSPKRKKRRIIRFWMEGLGHISKPAKYPSRKDGWLTRVTVFWAVVRGYVRFLLPISIKHWLA